MHGALHAACCATLLYPLTSPLATTVFRCEDAKGHITFTQLGCPGEDRQSLQEAYNPTPGKGKPIPLANPNRGSEPQQKSGTAAVVGEQNDGCGNRVTGSARREAMIRKEVRAGMPLADVESMLGKPDKISSQNGQLRYQYLDPDGRSRQVSFDEDRCVKGKP